MALSLNKVQLIGNLGMEPEMRSTKDGRKIANLRIATSERWKDRNSGEQREKTEWHRVVVFSEPLANIIERYVKKGARIYVEGQLTTRKWQDQTGNDRYTTEIVIQGFSGNLILLDGRDRTQSFEPSSPDPMVSSSGGGGGGGGGGGSTSGADPLDLDDEIPF